jgi:hypothetical protein
MKVPEMLGKPAQKRVAFESVRLYLIKKLEQCTPVFTQQGFCHFEIVIVVQYVQAIQYPLVTQMVIAVAHQPVEDGKCIPQRPIGLLGYQVQGIGLVGYPFFLSNGFQVWNDIGHLYPPEIENLAAAEDGWKDLVLFGSGQDEFGVCRGFFQCFQEGIESLLAQHVHLINDVYLVLATLRCVAHLLYQRADIFYTVVGGGIQFVDIERGVFVETLARSTGAAGFGIRAQILAVDGAGKYAGAGGFAYTTRPAKEECLAQLFVADGILKGTRHMLLPYYIRKPCRTVLAGRNDKLAHAVKLA